MLSWPGRLSGTAMSEKQQKRIVRLELPIFPDEPWKVILTNAFSTIKEYIEKSIKALATYTGVVVEESENYIKYEVISSFTTETIIELIVSVEGNNTVLNVIPVNRLLSYNSFVNNLFMMIRAHSHKQPMNPIGEAPKALIDILGSHNRNRESQSLLAEIQAPLAMLSQSLESAPVSPVTSEQKQYTAADAIKIYQKRKRQEKLLTLKKVCEELGLNYGSVRVAKARIDKQKKTKKKR